MLWIVIKCYDVDMHIWCSQSLIGNFSQVRMTHDKRYWQLHLRVKTSSWLKLSLCPLLRVVITMPWCELIGSLRRKFIRVPSAPLSSAQISMLPYTGDSWPGWPGPRVTLTLVLSDLSRNMTTTTTSSHSTERIKHRLLNKRSHSPSHMSEKYLYIVDCEGIKIYGSLSSEVLHCSNFFPLSVSSKIQPWESEAMRDLDRGSDRQQTWGDEGPDWLRRASQGWVCPLQPDQQPPAGLGEED